MEVLLVFSGYSRESDGEIACKLYLDMVKIK